MKLSSLRGGLPESLPIRARVIDRKYGYTKVETEDGVIHWLRGINGTDASVGAIGTVQYRNSATFGMWFFEEDTDEN